MRQQYCKKAAFGLHECAQQCSECREFQTSLDVPNALTSPWVTLPALFIVLAFAFYFAGKFANRFVGDEELTYSIAAMLFMACYIFITLIILKNN